MTHSTYSSSRLRADVCLYSSTYGYVLQVGQVRHDAHLSPTDAEALFDALATDCSPRTETARAALGSLVDAGLVDAFATPRRVVGDGVLAEALRAALTRMGAVLRPDGLAVIVQDDDRALPMRGDASWISGGLVFLTPPGVSARDVDARRAAATRHDDDPHTRPASDGRIVASTVPLPAAGIELAAAIVAAELLGRHRQDHVAVVVDLHGLGVSRRPVLPVPPAPR